MENFSHGHAVSVLAEHVTQLRRVDLALRERRLNGLEQIAERLEVGGLVFSIGVGGFFDGLPHELGEWADTLAGVQPARPTLDAFGCGQIALELQRTLLGRRDGARVAGHGRGDADLQHAGFDVVLDVLAVQQITVDLHLSRATGQIPERADLFVQSAQLVQRELIHRLDVDERGLKARLHCGEHRRVVALQHRQILSRRLALGAHAVARQHGLRGPHHVDVAGLADHIVLGGRHLLEEGHDLGRLDAGLIRRASSVEVQQLIALGLDHSSRVALGQCLLRGARGARLRSGVYVGLEVFDLLAAHQVRSELLGRLDHGVDRAGAGAWRAGVVRSTHGRHLSGQHPGAVLVVHSLVGGALHAPRRGVVAVFLQHHLIGQAIDLILLREGLGD